MICRNKDTSRIGERLVGGGMHHPVGDVGQPVAGNVDDPPAGVPQPGIEPENAHQRFRCGPMLPSGAEPRHHVFGHFEIGVDVLHIIAVFEGFEQLEEARRGLLVDRRGGLRAPDEARRAGRAESASRARREPR